MLCFKLCNFNNSNLYPLVCQLFTVGKSSFFIYFVLGNKQFCHIVKGEVLAFKGFPELCTCLVETDNFVEIDVLYAFRDDYRVAANVHQTESFFYSHGVYSLYLINLLYIAKRYLRTG